MGDIPLSGHQALGWAWNQLFGGGGGDKKKSDQKYWKWAEETYGVKRLGRGKYQAPDGRIFAHSYEAINHIVSKQESEAEKAGLKREVAGKQREFESLIKKSGAERSELARTRSARQTGHLTNLLKGRLSASGEDPERIGALTARVQGTSGRQLQDLLTGIEAQTTGQLAGAKQFDIGSSMNLEQLGLRRESLTNQMNQFLMGQNLSRDKFQAYLDMQPEWWEQMLGGAGQGAGQAGGAYLMQMLMGL
jgi:hypothetical protein